MVPVPPNREESKTPSWYKELEFSQDMSENQNALLEQKQVSTRGTTKTIILASKEVPEFGSYYHPKIGNQPWIDRVYVAKHPHDSDPYCLVLAQDKVSDSSFSDACQKLEDAANCLTGKAGHPKKALLIVSDLTRAQSKLTWPVNSYSRSERSSSVLFCQFCRHGLVCT